MRVAPGCSIFLAHLPPLNSTLLMQLYDPHANRTQLFRVTLRCAMAPAFATLYGSGALSASRPAIEEISVRFPVRRFG
jgi:hypothetical protein